MGRIKAYTRGWRNESGEMNINVKFENSYSASYTLMIRPNDSMGRLIHSAVGLRKACDDGNGEFTVYFRGNKEDMRNYADNRVGDYFEGCETIYVRRIG